MRPRFAQGRPHPGVRQTSTVGVYVAGGRGWEGGAGSGGGGLGAHIAKMPGLSAIAGSMAEVAAFIKGLEARTAA